MSLKDTIELLQQQLASISRDLDKSIVGNQSAAQRVRTMTIELAKTAKLYRKESLMEQKKKLIR